MGHEGCVLGQQNLAEEWLTVQLWWAIAHQVCRPLSEAEMESGARVREGE